MKTLRISVLLVLWAAMPGCRDSNVTEPVPLPRILAFDISVEELRPGTAAQIRQQLQSGTGRKLEDLLDLNRTCTFMNDVATSSPPEVRLSGNPGDPGFNLSYIVIRLSQSSNGNCVPGTHAIPTEIRLQSGRGLVLNQVNHDGVMEVAIGNDKFTADYREFTVTSVDAAKRHVEGKFQMFATNHANPQDLRAVFIAKGYFSTPH